MNTAFSQDKNNINIGDNSIDKFIDKIINYNLGGLFRTTSANGYRKENIKENYPRKASYEYILDIRKNTPMEFKRFAGGDILPAYNETTLDIGQSYTTDFNESKLNTITYSTVANFEELQKKLRSELLEKSFKHTYKTLSTDKEIIYTHPLFNDIFKEDIITKDGTVTDDKIVTTFNTSFVNEVADYTNAENNASTSTGKYERGESIISRTEKLFRYCKINSLINRNKTNIQNVGEELSRGRALKNQSNSDFCRVWTAQNQYSRMSDLIRPFRIDNETLKLVDLQKKVSEGMRPNNGAERLGRDTVLLDTGFVRITPSINDKIKGEYIKNYMFSIENLAWKDEYSSLSEEQKGPNGGRIMWFPPYNLKFSENINVNWNSNSFIGRGEQIYTYTNTERSGTLDFTILIDHPSIVNSYMGTGDGTNKKEAELLRFFAGCEVLKVDNTMKKNSYDVLFHKTNPQPSDPFKGVAIVLFFPKKFSVKIEDTNFEEIFNKFKGYEKTSNGDEYTYNGATNKNVFSLNNSPNEKIQNLIKNSIGNLIGNRNIDVENIRYLNDILTDDNIIDITAYDITKTYSFVWGVKDDITNQYDMGVSLLNKKQPGIIDPQNVELTKTEITKNDGDELDDKLSRMLLIVFQLKEKLKEATPTAEPSTTSLTKKQQRQAKRGERRAEKKVVSTEKSVKNIVDVDKFNNEYLYFREIAENDKMVETILKYVKHFTPAFHSITPEGFNSRLTFLQQCTRQGNTNAGESLGLATNLAFGLQPYCVLRVGDFFNTKICIDSVSINYDSGGGPQWDLNPEGIGIQPMFANISLNFKFIGGQDISGPVDMLQNAVSSNYYANTSIYDENSIINYKK